MSALVRLSEQNRIVTGQPLPFSVFSADGKLLLAAGRVVESDRLRDLLIRNGNFRSSLAGEDSPGGGGGGGGRGRSYEREPIEEPAGAPVSPLELLHRDYDTNKDGHRLSISIARSDTDRAYTVQLLGVHGNGQSIIVTAPVHRDGSLVPATPGQMWLGRTFQMTSAFRFRTLVIKAAFEPFPHLHLKLQRQVEHRQVRGSPRAKVSLQGKLYAPDVIPCVVSDLSTGGARVAVDASHPLERGRQVRLTASLEVLQSTFDLSLEATVVNLLGPSDARYPQVSFYGLKFSAPGESDSLVLHGFVSGHLLGEFNSLWQMLSLASGPEISPP